MQGNIIEFSMQRSTGAIAGEDGYRYDFHVSEWRSDEPPVRDLRVEFATDSDGVNAFDVRPILRNPASQQNSNEGNARPRSNNAVGSAPRYHHGGQPAHPPLPDNYLVWAIVVTILCCLPTGIVSIVYASKVNSLHKNGQYQEAKEAAESAKKWIQGSVALGVGIGILAFVGNFMAV